MSARPAPDHAALLLAEQQHRMKNVFQIVEGLLARETAKLGVPAALPLVSAAAQLRAFALLNDDLHRPAIAGPAPLPCLAAHLRRICAHLEAACLAPRGIALVLDLDDELPAPDLVCRNLALVVTELLVNAVKHAFGAVEDPRVGVASGRRDGVIRIAVADNGRGMPMPQPGRHRGLGYADMLMQAVGGRCACETGPHGTRFLLSVPA